MFFGVRLYKCQFLIVTTHLLYSTLLQRIVIHKNLGFNFVCPVSSVRLLREYFRTMPWLSYGTCHYLRFENHWPASVPTRRCHRLGLMAPNPRMHLWQKLHWQQGQALPPLWSNVLCSMHSSPSALTRALQPKAGSTLQFLLWFMSERI